MIRVRANTMNAEAGMRDRKILSNLSVKSKFPRHPTTAGPKAESPWHFEKSMVERYAKIVSNQTVGKVYLMLNT